MDYNRLKQLLDDAEKWSKKAINKNETEYFLKLDGGLEFKIIETGHEIEPFYESYSLPLLSPRITSLHQFKFVFNGETVDNPLCLNREIVTPNNGHMEVLAPTRFIIAANNELGYHYYIKNSLEYKTMKIMKSDFLAESVYQWQLKEFEKQIVVYETESEKLAVEKELSKGSDAIYKDTQPKPSDLNHYREKLEDEHIEVKYLEQCVREINVTKKVQQALVKHREGRSITK